MASVKPVGVAAASVATAAGAGLAPLWQALRTGASALQPNRQAPPGHEALATWVGEVAGLEDSPLPAPWQAWDCRANRLAWQGLQADDFVDAVARARTRHGPARVGLALGTSASTIGVSEWAYRHLIAGAFPPAVARESLNTLHAITAFVQQALALSGPALTVSTACSSSAKVFAVAERWLRHGLADAVVVGGVDALSDSLRYGFHALQLLSPEPCRPFDRARRGISLGEAAGFMLLTREPSDLQLLGYGEANDAFHMSSPHPEGAGAEAALRAALARAGVAGKAVGYVNLHGTASPKNDEVEAALVARCYPAHVPVGATKGCTGHTMGAAGIVEAAICGLALRHQHLPGTAQTQAPMDEVATQLVLQPRPAHVDVAVSHSFGFGGNNSVLVLGRAGAKP